MRKTVVFAMLFLFMLFLLIPVSAVTGGASVVHNISPSALEHTADGVLNDFSETNEGWDCMDLQTEVTVAERVDSFPYSPLRGNGCLIVRSDKTSGGQKNCIVKNYNTPIDLSEWSNIIFLVNCSNVGAQKYYLNVKIHSQNGLYEITEEIGSCGWNGVFADISSFEGRDSIKKIELAVFYDGNEEERFFEYYVDSIALSENANAYNMAYISAEVYYPDAGRSFYDDGVYTLSGIGDEVRITSNGFVYGDMGAANSLMIDFVTEGYCQGVRLFAKRDGGNFEEVGYSPVNLTNTTGSVYLPLSGDGIEEVRIEFEGVNLGSLKLLGVTPYSYVFDESDEGIEITTCVLNQGTGEIFIRGSVDRALLGGREGELLLFANDLCDEINSETVHNIEPLQKTKINSDSFIFRVDYDGKSDGRTLICKKYTVAVKLGNEFVGLSGSKCVANPADLADKGVKIPAERNGKGVYGDSISFMQTVGASDTVIWVDIGKFFVQESEGNSRFECGGNLYYYDLDYYTSLNTMISNFAEKDIDVTVVFVVSNTENEALNRVLIHKDADLDSKYCAYNTSDRQGLSYLRAITTFFASRYCEDMSVKRFVFGDCVGNAFSNYNMGKKTIAEFAFEYANGMRIIYNIARSYSPYVEVYTYIDDNWDSGLPFDLYVRYDNKVFIDVLDECISLYGDFDWGVAQNPYPANTTDYSSYKDLNLDNDMLADRVSFKNIGVITNYLKRSEMTFNNTARDYIIIEQSSFDAFDEEHITADYVYNCYKALNSGVSAYITDRNSNYNDAMKYVDTNYSLTACDFVSDILDVATWENVIEGFSGKNIQKRTITVGKVVSSEPNIIGRVNLSDFSSDADGWERYGFTERLKGGSELSGKNDLLSVSLGNTPKGESRGIVKKFDSPLNMENSPILHFSINVASLPTNTDTANIIVYIRSGNNSYELDGVIKEADWTDLYCDFSAFAHLDKVDRIGIIFTANENYYDSPQATISQIELVSTEYDNAMLEEFNSNTNKSDGFLGEIRVYLYSGLVGVIVLASLVFVWRRVKKVK